MKFFHASNHDYAPGKVIGPFDRPKTSRGWIDSALDGFRPAHAVSRELAVYAFDSLAHAALFAKTENLSHVYEVEIQAPPRPAVLSLVDRLRVLGKGHTLTAELAAEYWTPSARWELCEYLAATCTVHARVALPDEMELYAAQMAYTSDCAQARVRFPT